MYISKFNLYIELFYNKNLVYKDWKNVFEDFKSLILFSFLSETGLITFVLLNYNTFNFLIVILLNFYWKVVVTQQILKVKVVR